MKYISFAAAAIVILGASAAAAAQTAFAAETVSSPDGSITAEISCESGIINYNVYKDGISVLSDSRLGIRFEDADMTSGLSLTGRSDNVIDESYSMPGGKASVYENRANEAVLTFEKDGKELELYVRVYDDGAAVRYGYSNDTRVISEETVFSFPAQHISAWAMEYEKSYEQFYLENELSALSGSYGMPMTLQLSNELYVMLTEAGLDGSYAGSVLNASDRDLRVGFEPKQTEPVEITGPFLSPWRTAVIGGLDTIVQTQMPENLSEPCRIDDTSWIVPGVSGWTWFNGDPTNEPEVYKQYIDLCAEMGWQYMLLDEGWQPGTIDELGRKTYSGLNSWVSDVINYADSKGIGIIVWAASWDLDTPEERERLAEWADMGIKGVKVDFFDSETQTTLRLCDEITEETAALRLLVNYHGCSKPTGERRTWPHLITREAVYGTEHFLSGEGWGPTAQHNCTLPFTRGAVGPMDYTPAITNYYNKNYFSAGQKAALPIIFESGIQCFSDKPENYRSSVLAGLLKDFPAAWDETRLLSGEIGSSAVMMRRSGETYYIGMICNEQRTEDVRLDFLDEGAVYEAELYRDGASDTEITLERLLVKKGDIITVPETVHGGAAIKLTKTDIIVPYDAAGHWCETAVRQLVSEDRLNGYFGVELDPDAYITRAEFVTMLVTAAGIDAPAANAPFPDCTGSRAKNYIAAAVAEGMINGVSADEFAPDALITREQAVTIIGRYMKLSGGISLDFTDSSEISDYAKMYVSVCAKNGIINGYEDGSFRPKNMMTRGECAAIMALI